MWKGRFSYREHNKDMDRFVGHVDESLLKPIKCHDGKYSDILS